MTFTAPDVVIERDRYGRPLIVPPGGGDPKPYTRVTTLAGTLDDMYGLTKWKQRQTVRGLVGREDLLLAAKADVGNDRKLDQLCEQAMEAAGSSASATIGTALHTLTELLDTGGPVPELDADTARALKAYHLATSHLEMLAVEQFLVCDEISTAGTADRIVQWGGQRFIADLKTGGIKYGIGKISMQLAIYAHSQTYDPATHERTPIDVNQRNAIVIHMPKGEGTCRLWWVDIASGWEAVQTAITVRDWRKRSDLSATAGDLVSG